MATVKRNADEQSNACFSVGVFEAAKRSEQGEKIAKSALSQRSPLLDAFHPSHPLSPPPQPLRAGGAGARHGFGKLPEAEGFSNDENLTMSGIA